MFNFNIIEKLKIVFSFRKKQNKKERKELFIAARKLDNRGEISSQGEEMKIISEDLKNTGKISQK